MRTALRKILPEPVRRSLRHLRGWRPIVDYRLGHQHATFLAGSSRSGTTWVADLINYRGDYRYMFEPFAPMNTKYSKQFKYLLYIRPDDTDPRYLRPAWKIVSGRAPDRRGVSRNPGTFYRKRLIKEVRANLWLKWLHVQFPGLPLILLLRHPCAVTLSRTRRKLHNYFNNVFRHTELFEDHLEPFRGDLEAARSADPWEQRMFTWCIEHYVPLKQFHQGQIHLAFYENFIENPKAELDRLFAFLGQEYEEKILDTFQRPSSRAKEWSAIVTGEHPLESWRQGVSAEQLHRSMEILSLFGLDKIYSADSKPNLEAAYAMLGSTNSLELSSKADDHLSSHI